MINKTEMVKFSRDYTHKTGRTKKTEEKLGRISTKAEQRKL